jgi:hypothetical protein
MSSDFVPFRLCCGLQHHGPVCPDGKVMCCICFERVGQDELAVDPEDGKKWDVCRRCRDWELEGLRQREG